MREILLHHIWLFRLFDHKELLSTQGEKIEILNPGELNTNAGPDFFNARIKIGGMLWAGNVEIHVKASDWMRHKHSADRAYDNVVLHVVGHADQEIIQRNGHPFPAFEILPRIEPSLLQQIANLSKINAPYDLQDYWRP